MATQKEVADHIDLSVRQVQNLLKSGVLPTAVGKGLDVEACRLAYIRHMRGKVTGQVASSPGELDAQEERARLTHHQANIAALEEQELSGELLRRDSVVAEVTEAIANCRAKLITLPPKMASVVVAMDDLQEVRTALQAGVYEALDELHSQYVSDESGGESLEEPADADS